jgi:tetratricopeptide (TPR) repeat protein
MGLLKGALGLVLWGLLWAWPAQAASLSFATVTKTTYQPSILTPANTPLPSTTETVSVVTLVPRGFAVQTGDITRVYNERDLTFTTINHRDHTFRVDEIFSELMTKKKNIKNHVLELDNFEKTGKLKKDQHYNWFNVSMEFGTDFGAIPLSEKMMQYHEKDGERIVYRNQIFMRVLFSGLTVPDHLRVAYRKYMLHTFHMHSIPQEIVTVDGRVPGQLLMMYDNRLGFKSQTVVRFKSATVLPNTKIPADYMQVYADDPDLNDALIKLYSGSSSQLNEAQRSVKELVSKAQTMVGLSARDNLPDKAEGFLKEALLADPRNIYAYLVLRDVYNKQENYEGAWACTQAVLALDSQHPLKQWVMGAKRQLLEEFSEY